MNTGQLLLVIAALSLLSTIALSVNRTLLDNDTMMIEAQSGVLAVSLCHGKIEEHIRADFDSLAVGETADTLFTPYSAFVCTTLLPPSRQLFSSSHAWPELDSRSSVSLVNVLHNVIKTSTIMLLPCAIRTLSSKLLPLRARHGSS